MWFRAELASRIFAGWAIWTLYRHHHYHLRGDNTPVIPAPMTPSLLGEVNIFLE